MEINSTSITRKDCINFTMPYNEVVAVKDEEVGMKAENKELFIADNHTPLVIMFGPRACGKTMVLVRLTRYLQSKGYNVQPISSLRPANDKKYMEICLNYDSMIKGKNVPFSHIIITPLLVGISTHGNRICQILDIPGDFCFDFSEMRGDYFKGNMDSILKLNNRKIWLVMVNPSQFTSHNERVLYADVLRKLKEREKLHDSVIFVLNKIDATPFVVGSGNIKYSLALQHIEFLYPNIFVPFRNVNPITKWWRPNNFDFTAFQTGDFSEAADGTLTFEEGPDIYPQRLWAFIQKRIRG